ncbi:MAG TPA: FAD-dependent monooxygenase [Thermoleophilaceae bacterium]|nr:FAD-dependent monooxygenase [Thermoleophilaceae bacterium]
MSVGVEEFEVVVVGAGPGGLASGVTLGSYGVDTLVVERRLSSSTLPRATVASTGTMELLRRWGLEQRAWERSIDVEWQAWACPTLAAVDDGETVEVGLPTREQAALVSPTSPACLGQDELEPLLEEHLGSLASVRLERGVELVGLEHGRDGGHVLTLAGPGERRRAIRARYVIGADGMRSRVREELGITTEGSEKIAERLGVLFHAPIWNLVREHRYGIYFVTGEPEESSFLPAGEPDRWLFGMPWDTSAGDVEALTTEQVKRWIRDAAGDPGLPIEIDRWMTVTFGVGLAERFRAGDAFLIGDAAHRVSPRGGTGLNTAIRDGFDIGWKLAWVLRGFGGERLLESYERERRPVAEFNTQRSVRADGSILGTGLGLSADIGGRIGHVWVPRDGGLVSTLDLLDGGLTLFVGPDWDGSLPTRDPGSPPVTVQRLDAIAARGLGLTTTGSLLARPDGYPVALWNGDEPGPARLAGAIAAASGSAPAARVGGSMRRRPSGASHLRVRSSRAAGH